MIKTQSEKISDSDLTPAAVIPFTPLSPGKGKEEASELSADADADDLDDSGPNPFSVADALNWFRKKDSTPMSPQRFRVRDYAGDTNRQCGSNWLLAVTLPEETSITTLMAKLTGLSDKKHMKYFKSGHLPKPHSIKQEILDTLSAIYYVECERDPHCAPKYFAHVAMAPMYETATGKLIGNVSTGHHAKAAGTYQKIDNLIRKLTQFCTHAYFLTDDALPLKLEVTSFIKYLTIQKDLLMNVFSQIKQTSPKNGEKIEALIDSPIPKTPSPTFNSPARAAVVGRFHTSKALKNTPAKPTDASQSSAASIKAQRQRLSCRKRHFASASASASASDSLPETQSSPKRQQFIGPSERPPAFIGPSPRPMQHQFTAFKRLDEAFQPSSRLLSKIKLPDNSPGDSGIPTLF